MNVPRLNIDSLLSKELDQGKIISILYNHLNQHKQYEFILKEKIKRLKKLTK